MPLVTGYDIINTAASNLNLTQVGVALQGPQADDAFKRLNRMLGGWALQKLTIPATAGETFPLVGGKGGPSNPYTIGVGGNFNTDKPPSPDYISAVKLAMGGTTPVIEIDRVLYTREAYQDIAIKELSNEMFTGIYYFPTAGPLGFINLWPVPDTTLHKLVLYHDSPLTSFVNLTTPYSLPLGYDEALIYQFERRMAGAYGRVMPADDALLAAQGMRLIKRNNVELTDMPNDFGCDRRGGYDINLGGPHNGAA